MRYGDRVLCRVCTDSAGQLAAPATPLPSLIAQYQSILGSLWLLNIDDETVRSPHAHAADLEDAKHLLDQQARLHDELGDDMALAVSRRHAWTWAQMMKRCPWCGMPGRFHDPDGGAESVL